METLQLVETVQASLRRPEATTLSRYHPGSSDGGRLDRVRVRGSSEKFSSDAGGSQACRAFSKERMCTRG